VTLADRIEPDPRNARLYAEGYRAYRALYQLSRPDATPDTRTEVS